MLKFVNAAVVSVLALLLQSHSQSLEEVTISGAPTTITLGWETKAGYTYEAQRSEDLHPDSWQTIGQGLEGNIPQTTWFYSESNVAGRAFYRISQSAPEIDSQETEELLSNPKFTTDASPWFTVFNSASGANGSLSGGSGELQLGISDGGSSSFHVQLLHNGLTLSQGQSYTLSFIAKTTSGTRNMTAMVQATTNPASNIFVEQTVELTSTGQTFSMPFNMTSASGNSSRIAFNLGGDTTDVIFECVSLTTSSTIQDRLGAHQLNKRLGRGNNFAAYMATVKQGAKEDYILLRENNFSHCRIGYKLDELVGGAADYVVPEAEMAEIQRLVDLCLAEGLIAIIDPVHNWANGPGFTYPDDLPKFLAIWEQVATHFADYPNDSIIYELLNEPHGNSSIAQITSQGVNTVRAVSGNEEKAIIVSGEGFSTRQALINAFNDDEFPANDNWLIATFHYYDPKAFTTPDQAGNGSAIPWADGGASDSEFSQVVTDFAAVQAANVSWATRNNTEPLPIFLGEFGCDNIALEADRKRWLSWIRLQAEALDFSWSHWLMYNDVDFSKGMGPWGTAERNDPALREFQPEVVEALIGKYEAENATLISNAEIGTDLSEREWVQCDALGEGLTKTIYVPREQEYGLIVTYQTTADIEITVESKLPDGTLLDSVNVILPMNTYANSWSRASIPLILASDDQATLSIAQGSAGSFSIDSIELSL